MLSNVLIFPKTYHLCKASVFLLKMNASGCDVEATGEVSAAQELLFLVPMILEVQRDLEAMPAALKPITDRLVRILNQTLFMRPPFLAFVCLCPRLVIVVIKSIPMAREYQHIGHQLCKIAHKSTEMLIRQEHRFPKHPYAFPNMTFQQAATEMKPVLDSYYAAFCSGHVGTLEQLPRGAIEAKFQIVECCLKRFTPILRPYMVQLRAKRNSDSGGDDGAPEDRMSAPFPQQLVGTTVCLCSENHNCVFV